MLILLFKNYVKISNFGKKHLHAQKPCKKQQKNASFSNFLYRVVAVEELLAYFFGTYILFDSKNTLILILFDSVNVAT